MSNRNYGSNFLSPILSAITAIGAIIAALSPLLLSKTGFSSMFVDAEAPGYSSVVAFILVISLIWLLSGNRSYSIFSNRPALNWENTKLKSLIFFALFAGLFYSTKILYQAGIIGKPGTIITQFLTYEAMFGFLAFTIGILFRDSFIDYKQRQLNENKFELIREALVQSGFLEIDLVVRGIANRVFTPGDPLDWLGAKDMYFVTNGKEYRAIVSDNYSHILACAEEKQVLPPAAPERDDGPSS